MRARLLLPVVAVTSLLLSQTRLPVMNAGGPDAALLGQPDGYPVGAAATMFDRKYLVGDFTHFDKLFPAHIIPAAQTAWNFRYAADPPEIQYTHAGQRYAISDYLNRVPVTGLLIAKDDQILYEAYQYGRTPQDLFTSQSMAKSFVAMLAGIAIGDHAIASVEDTAGKYAPELNGSVYGESKLVDLLHMSSGIACQGGENAEGVISFAAVKTACLQKFPPGTHFAYSAMDSAVLGLVVSDAVHKPLSSYLEDKIWSQIGTASKASWNTDDSGHDLAFCCFNATLRDYARMARMLAFDGAWNGKQIIPKEWMLQATTIPDSAPQLAPGKPAPFFGYGFQIWLFPGPRRMFVLLGANGQRIFVDPESKVILVQTAVMEKPVDLAKDAETIGLWLSVDHRYR